MECFCIVVAVVVCRHPRLRPSGMTILWKKRSSWTCFRIYCLGSLLCCYLTKSYWKVSVQYPLFSFFYNDRSWTTTFQDDGNNHDPSGRSWNKFRTTGFFYCFSLSSRSVFIRVLVVIAVIPDSFGGPQGSGICCLVVIHKGVVLFFFFVIILLMRTLYIGWVWNIKGFFTKI